MTNPLPDEPDADVCAVLVTYHPDAGFAARAARIAPQVAHTVIVDNGSDAGAMSGLHALTAHPGIALIANGANLGIARGLNQGIEYARSRGCGWAVLLDQDSAVDDTLVKSLRAVAADFPGPRLAVVGARFRDTQGRPADTLPLGQAGGRWREVESVITSGSLVSLAAHAAIGPFRDDFFIDYVDTEYCLRARALGYAVIETREPLMSHTVGAPSRHLAWGKTRWTTNHSAERRYYIARNNTVMLREYGTRKGRSWRWKSLVRSYRLTQRIALYEDDRVAKILAVWQGWRDALRGTMGPRPKR